MVSNDYSTSNAVTKLALLISSYDINNLAYFCFYSLTPFRSIIWTTIESCVPDKLIPWWCMPLESSENFTDFLNKLETSVKELK
jgi:hypothetical protein